MPEYIRTEHGLPQRVWPHNKRKESPEERIRRYTRQRASISDSQVRTDRISGEIDRGSYAYRIGVLLEAIRRHSQYRQEQPQYQYQPNEDGWY